MTNFTEKFNFSNREMENSIKIDPRRDVNYYETLCKYCADHNIDLSSVSEDEFSAAAEMIKDYGSNDMERESYFFSIDKE